MGGNSDTITIDTSKLLASYMERRDEADPRAQKVLDEFIRLAELLPPEAIAWREVIALEQDWRDSLSDSEVIRFLRGIQRDRTARKSRRHR